MEELSRFTTDELLTELKTRMAITNCDISLKSREFTFRMVTKNPSHIDESLEGDFSYILANIEEPPNINTFSEEAAKLGVNEIYTEKYDDDDSYEYTLTIARLV